MKVQDNIIKISFILMFIIVGSVGAQENLAQEAYAIFERNCWNCHGTLGNFKEQLFIERNALVDTGVVIPGDPENSEFYKRLLGPTENGGQMPLNLSPLSAEAIETIARWITAGAPDWEVQQDTNFITTDAMLDAIKKHVQSLPQFDRAFARYFTLTHLYNAGENPKTLSDYRIALSKLVNSLSWGYEVINPTPVDTAETIFYIDLRHYEWDIRAAWTQIEQAYPYDIAFDPETQAGLLEKQTQLQTETGSTVPFVNVDWFLATASLPPLYHDILDLPQTDLALETQLGVNVQSNIKNAPGVRVWRAGFNDSKVSHNNRVVERHTSQDGAYWKSYDFAGNIGSQNIFTHPLDFTHDGGEIIFNLPNGLQAYYLVDAKGSRLNDAPINIVSNPAASDPTVRNGLSCIGCHTQGMRKFNDAVHAAIEKDQNPSYDKTQALRLYPGQSVLDGFLTEDTQRFTQALEKIGGPFADDEARQQYLKALENEPIQRFHETFQGPLSAAHAAAAVGFEKAEFLTQISEKQSLKNLGLLTLTDENGTVKRDAWTANFDAVMDALNTPDSVLPPIVDRPEIIPGTSVNIPDPNLRTAIETALGKASGDVITAEDMATLTLIDINSMGIRDVSDLTGLEFAINLEVLNVQNSPISDLSPLANLTKLRKLDTGHSKISDLSPLQGLTGLKRLLLYDSKVTDISPIAGLTELTWFGVQHSGPITDFSPLTALTKLEHLNLAGTGILDLSILTSLTNLKTLKLEHNQIEDVSPLLSLTNLEKISLHFNNITDFSPLDSIRDNVEISWHGNPSFPTGGPKIEGPWLWMLVNVPGKNSFAGTDLLLQASGGTMTELDVATNGVTIGTPIGENVWTAHKIASTGGDNINALLNAVGMERQENRPSVVYGSVILRAPREQKVNMFAGSDLDHKVWLNGEFIHQNLSGVWSREYQDFFPVTLKEGINVLLVAIYGTADGEFSGYFGFGEDTEYTVLPPGIVIPDPNLRAVIAETLGKESADNVPITLAEMATLTTLRASNKDIQDLTGLEYAMNLTEMWISGNPVSDLSPLAGLTNFIGLHAWKTPISDLSPLADLSKLRWLDFGRTPTDANGDLIGNLDLTPLAGLTSLKKLTFYACGIQDISPLANLTGLTHLAVGGNREISDASPVAWLINLEHLDFHHDSISDLRPLAGLTKLKHLNLYDNRLISDLSPLAGLTSLTSLRLAQNIISDLLPLTELKKLKELHLGYNRISDVSPLAGLINLEALHLPGNMISDISSLDHLLENTFIYWLKNPGAPKEGPKLEGPWLCVLIPGKRLDSDTDFLAETSDGSVTEHQIATKGATEGKAVGDNKWTPHKISPTGRNNFKGVLRSFGVPPDQDTSDNVVYGCIILGSPREQNAKMLAGSEGHHKIWLNGDLIHQDVGLDAHDSRDYGIFFPVTLKQGANILLVAVDNGHWITGHFGFEEGTEYVAFLPSNIAIPDQNLRAVIAETLGKESADNVPITLEEMATLTELQAGERGISDLTGLQFAPNLQELKVRNNQISDLSPLENLINLEKIDLSYNALSDLLPLSGLINLREIDFGNNLVSDLSPLKNLKKLGDLKLWNSPVSDFSPLSGLTKLETLILADQGPYELGIVDLSPIAGLTNLSYLTIHNLDLSDLSALTGLINLKTLIFNSNNVSDVSPLANLINLEGITTWGNPISDFSPLANLTKLKTVDICGADIADLSFLAGKPELTELYLRSNDISDVSHLAQLTGLTRLNLEDNKISDVSPLAGLTNLTWLKLLHNPITDFSPLEALAQTANILTGEVAIPDPTLRAAIAAALGKDANDTFVSITVEEMATITEFNVKEKNVLNLTGIEFATNLRRLDLLFESLNDKGFLSDLSPLAGLTDLKWLRISGKSITDLSPLSELMSLEHLELVVTDVSDLSPLANLPKLKTLWFNHAPVSDISPLGSITSLEDLQFYYTETPSLEPLKGLSRLKKFAAARSRISDISPLSELVNLEEVDLFDGSISDISPLTSLHKLRRLNIIRNKVSDVSSLASLHNLEWLHLAHNKITDISPLESLPKNPKIIWYENPGFPVGGPKIEGPWLWARVPGPHLNDNTDFLAQASGGNLTELQIATEGAAAGESVGESTWTTHKISASVENNIAEMIEVLGWTSGEETSGYILYGSIKLNSPREQQTQIFVGASDSVKVWLNGQLVHKKLGRVWWEPQTINYQHIVPVTLNEGINVLLVAIDNTQEEWKAFFGFEPGTEYTVPSIGYSISETKLIAGDTFTLNLNAENMTDLAGWQADIAFDPNVLEAVEVTEGDFLKSEGKATFFQGGTIDNTAGKIKGLSAARIAESGVNGTGTLIAVTFIAKLGGETQITLENFEFGTMTGDIIPTVPPNITITVGEYPAWDVNQDGRVSILDIILVANDLGSDTPTNSRTDVNRDGEVNIQDIVLVAQYIGESTDSAAPAIDGEKLTPAVVQAWIMQAQVEDDGSTVFRQGIENLKKLLASLLPEKTALLPNYPNPFNPETWVPYHLAKPAAVTLTIYAANGPVVRTLVLGHQAAGIYQSRSRAAHWDGRNEVGESVASGVYFYTLTAGDFTATRKMLILK